LRGSVPSFDNIIIRKNLKEMFQARKRIYFLAALTIFAIILPASNCFATVNHSIHIEWDYETYLAPEGLELTAYRLYKEGVEVCQFDYPDDFAGDCEFQSENGRFNFTLTAVFDDGSESPESAPFPFLLGTDRGAQTGALLAVLGLLLK
jgi:hypothetical protein